MVSDSKIATTLMEAVSGLECVLDATDENKALIEGAESIIEKFCDNFCKHPALCENQDELDEHCDSCIFIDLINLLGK